MKIAIVRQRYNPYGGAERFVERALGALAGEGAEVTLITRSWDGAPRDGFRQITCDPPYSRLWGGVPRGIAALPPQRHRKWRRALTTSCSRTSGFPAA